MRFGSGDGMAALPLNGTREEANRADFWAPDRPHAMTVASLLNRLIVQVLRGDHAT